MLGARRRSLVELAGFGVARETVAALERLLAGAAGFRFRSRWRGCWCVAVAAELAVARCLCRPRWLMDWTYADSPDNAADRTTTRRVCAAGRA